jgi:hypothetical protein
MGEVIVPKTPLLATVKGVELGSVGYWDISNVDDWHPSADDLASAVAAMDCKAVRRPVLKCGHSGDAGNDPSIGLVDNLRVSDDGQTLIGDFVGVPAWLAEADGEGRSVLASAYPDRSGEWEHNYVCQLGHVHPFVLHAMALLGVVRPGIGTLESLYDLYSKAPIKEEIAMATVALAAGTTIDQVRHAYYDGPGSNWALWIREMFIEPPELIVQNDDTDSLIRVPYTAGDDGAVEFGEGQPVKVEYVEARAKVEKPTLAYASKSEARPSAPKTPLPVEAEGTQEKESTVAFTEAALKKLGLDADADEGAINAAIEGLPDAPPEGGATTADDAPPAELETPAQVAAAAKKLGMTVLDEETDRSLRADAAAGREALSRIQRDEDARVVKSAIADGKIFPSREAHYMGLMERDREGTTEWLAGVAKESAVALSEMGHATEPVDNPTDNPAYQKWSF